MKRIALAAFALVALAASAVAQVIPPGTNPVPVGGAYNSSPTTCVNGSGCWFQVDSSGYLKVNVAAGGASGGTSSTFGAAFPATGTAAGMSQGGNMVALTGTANNLNVNCQVGCSGGSFNNNADAVATSATNGQVAAWLYGYNGATFDRLQVDGAKNLKVAASVASGGIASGALASGSVASGAVASGAFASGALASGSIASGAMVDFGSQADAACSTDNGSCSLEALIKRNNQNLTTINTSVGAAIPAGTNLIGKVGIDQTTPGTTNGVAIVGVNGATALAGNGATGTGSPRITIASDNSALPAAGQGATAASVPAGATQAGGRAQNAEATAVTNGQLAAIALDLVGKQIVLPYANPENFVQGTTAAMTGTTSTSLVASPGGALRNYITHISCSNSHATVGTFVTVQDGSGGTALMTLAAGANFGGDSKPLLVPLKQPTVATALFVANVTTGANVICNAIGYKGI